MGNLSKLPERLKELMFDKGISAGELASAVYTKNNTITRYLQGVSSPAYDIFIRLVEYFNCSADFLLGTGELPLYEKKFLSIPPFSVRLRQVIEECKTTQYALKKQTGLSWNNFHKWLNGKSLPSPDSLLTLATALEVSVDYLLGRIS
ncbi:MAG: helix-turn-helix domain-containing protein [Clostridia bacterium]|nr:helix-turn-helix domain-containing protein [Clostridia bacterium]